jgi:hypothetical protein
LETVGICLAFILSGIGMIWPNDQAVGWGLVAAGIALATIILTWRLFLKSPEEPEAPHVGDITIRAGDNNTIGDIGHKIDNESKGGRL